MQKVTVTAKLDGGYGWVVTLSAFMTGVILDGFSFSFGLFYDEFLDYFQESKAKTAWIGSVYNGMYMTIGPIVSFLCNRYGCRAVSMSGGLLAGIACLLAVFANCVTYLIITYGFLGGFGFGMMYLPAIVMVGHYFERKRALATGVAVCGSGVGGFVFAYFTKFLINHYTWRGATLILSGVALNGIIFGALLRPLEASVAVVEPADPAAAAADTVDESVTDAAPRRSTANSKSSGTAAAAAAAAAAASKQPKTDFYLSLQDWHNSVLSPTRDDSNDLNKSQPLISAEADATKKVVHLDIARPKYRQDAFLIGSCASFLHKGGSAEAVGNFASMTDVAAVRHEILRQHEPNGSVRQKLKKFGRNFAKKFRLLTANPALCVYGVSCFLCMAGFFVPFTYIPVYAKTLSLHESAPQDLISAIGWVNMISRLLIGWVADRPWADCLALNSAALIIGGVVTGLFVFYRSFVLLALACVVFGSSIAIFVALRSIIGVELVGVQNLSEAFGIIISCQGLSSFIGTPIAGLLADITGDIASTFYFAGGCIGVAGLICVPLRRISSWSSDG